MIRAQGIHSDEDDIVWVSGHGLDVPSILLSLVATSEQGDEKPQ
jgi:hypothetical protein